MAGHGVAKDEAVDLVPEPRRLHEGHVGVGGDGEPIGDRYTQDVLQFSKIGGLAADIVHVVRGDLVEVQDEFMTTFGLPLGKFKLDLFLNGVHGVAQREVFSWCQGNEVFDHGKNFGRDAGDPGSEKMHAEMSMTS